MKKGKEFKRTLVTTALPYANGPLHIGHLAGVYIPADIYVRYLRLKKRDVLLVGGSDEHGVPITIKAKREGVSPQDIVDRYHRQIKESFEAFGISFDIYSRTSDPDHHQFASEFFQTLYDKGELEEQTSMQYYDEQQQCFLADRYIKGTCPKCGNNEAYGDQCEVCGSSLSPMELIDPKSTISGIPPIKKETTHWYLPLDKYQPALRKWILEEHKEWKPNVYGQCKSWLDSDLKPRAVTRDLNWGISVPLKDANGKVLYVWFDAPLGYISATKKLTPQWEDYWKKEDSKIVHFIGKDNIVFHCIIFPVMLQAEGSYTLPDNVPANEFLNLEGGKLSTSRNRAVWLHEYLKDFPNKEDILKYVLTANAPETKDNFFTWKDFQARNNSELVAIVGNFIHRTIVLTNKYFDGKVPSIESLRKTDTAILDQLSTHKEAIENALEEFKFRDGLKSMIEIARVGNKYIADEEPWKCFPQDKEKTAQILYVCLQITAHLAIAMEPFMPRKAQELRTILSMTECVWENLGQHNLLPVGHKIQKPKLLFEKIEDDIIETQMNKLKTKEEASKAEQLALETQHKPIIQFDDFQKIELKVGEILEAEQVPKTDKLICMKVDLGTGQRTIISGIAEHYQPEELIGKQVSVVVNLAPRKLRGIESQGMLLLSEGDNGKLTFISPEQKVNNGDLIS